MYYWGALIVDDCGTSTKTLFLLRDGNGGNVWLSGLKGSSSSLIISFSCFMHEESLCSLFSSIQGVAGLPDRSSFSERGASAIQLFKDGKRVEHFSNLSFWFGGASLLEWCFIFCIVWLVDAPSQLIRRGVWLLVVSFIF